MRLSTPEKGDEIFGTVQHDTGLRFVVHANNETFAAIDARVHWQGQSTLLNPSGVRSKEMCVGFKLHDLGPDPNAGAIFRADYDGFLFEGRAPYLGDHQPIHGIKGLQLGSAIPETIAHRVSEMHGSFRKSSGPPQAGMPVAANDDFDEIRHYWRAKGYGDIERDDEGYAVRLSADSTLHIKHVNFQFSGVGRDALRYGRALVEYVRDFGDGFILLGNSTPDLRKAVWAHGQLMHVLVENHLMTPREYPQALAYLDKLRADYAREGIVLTPFRPSAATGEHARRIHARVRWSSLIKPVQ